MVGHDTIENQRTKVAKLKREFNRQKEDTDSVALTCDDFNDPSLLIEMNKLNIIRNLLVDEEKKLEEMQNEFDSRINPLEQVEGYGGRPLFRMKVPNNVEKQEEKVKEFGWFIADEGYDVISVDKQKGYLTTVYTFFVEKRRELLNDIRS